MYQTSFIPQGWECPKCKRVYSPNTMMCSHCPENTQGITSSGTTLSVASSGTTTFTSHNFKGNNIKCKICGLQKWQHPHFSHT